MFGLSRLLTSAGNFVYPPQCPRCGCDVDGAGFCDECISTLDHPVENICQRCAAPIGPHLDAIDRCIHCKSDRFRFEKVYALGAYEDELAETCRRAKQPDGDLLAGGLTDLLLSRHQADWTSLGIDLVVPVPHHWTTRLAEHHQPPVTMASLIAKRLGIRCNTRMIKKRRRTPPQSSLPPTERRKNLRDAFGISRRMRLPSMTVLLTDDILTTGTTANQVSKVLAQAGAGRIFVAVWARGLGMRPS